MKWSPAVLDVPQPRLVPEDEHAVAEDRRVVQPAPSEIYFVILFSEACS
jgi:hypothetical protein